MDEKTAGRKLEALTRRLKGLESVLVAFSGGVDSTLLLAVARQALGKRVLAVTARSPIHPSREIREAASFCNDSGIAHLVFDSREMNLPQFVANPPDRCYHCKRMLFQDLREMAAGKNLRHIVHGANADDLQEVRPGDLAAREAGALAPLMDVRLDKPTIRLLSRELGLPTWNKPSMACLATRIPYGTRITSENLRMVEAAEEFLAGQGFPGARVRHHGSLARIEVDRERMARILETGLKEDIVGVFRSIGFSHVALDLEGYISGKMNRELSAQGHEV